MPASDAHVTTSFDLPVAMRRRVSICAAALDVTASEYFRLAIGAALADQAAHDPLIASAFKIMDQRDHDARQLLDRVKVPAA